MSDEKNAICAGTCSYTYDSGGPVRNVPGGGRALGALFRKARQ